MTQALQKEISSIVDQLVVHYKPDKIILFGSAARDKATEDSDLDFFIIKRDVPRVGRERYYQLAKTVSYGRASDFLICTPQEVETRMSLGDPFMKHVLTEGKILYG